MHFLTAGYAVGKMSVEKCLVGAKDAFLEPFYTQNDHFTKTGSGQTRGKHSKMSCVFLDTPIRHNTSADPLPLYPVGSGQTVGHQIFIWGAKSKQIIAAGSGEQPDKNIN
jgi:hypothetical protein